jgi:hypothetical protein
MRSHRRSQGCTASSQALLLLVFLLLLLLLSCGRVPGRGFVPVRGFAPGCGFVAMATSLHRGDAVHHILHDSAVDTSHGSLFSVAKQLRERVHMQDLGLQPCS